MRQNITRAMKKDFTNQWSELFPEMGVYKPMWLMNILGPFAVGVLLHVKSDRDRYVPTLHVHNLAEEFDFISLGIQVTARNDFVSTISKEDKYLNIEKELRSKMVVSTEGDVELKKLIKNIKEYSFATPELLRSDPLEKILYLASWSGDAEVITDAKNFVEAELKKFSNFMLEGDRGMIKWYERTIELIKDTNKLRDTVNQQIIELKLDKLPVRKIIY